MDDRELLQEYWERQSETAFAELVSRHVRLVYATALRLTGERQAAQDVAQSVFLLLARKSYMVRDGAALPGWLYRATHRTALNDLRREQRRRQRETVAMNNADLNSSSSPLLAQLLPLLDEALRELSPRDQNLIVLRFFENKSLREAGAAASLSEQATHNRITRAVEKMRQYFARAGVTVPSTAVVTVLTAPSSQAVPAGLAAIVTGAALAGSGATLGVGDALLKFFLTMSTKTQIALAVAVACLIAVPFLRSASLPNKRIVAATTLAALTSNPDQPAPATPAPPPPTATPVQSAVAPSLVIAANSAPPVAPQPSPTRPLRTPNSSNGRPAGLPANVTASASVQNILAQPQADTSTTLSHNVAVRITGNLGTNHPIDIMFVGIQNFGRTYLFGTTEDSSGRVFGPLAIQGQLRVNVSLVKDGYQVSLTAIQSGGMDGSPYNDVTKGSPTLKPGETASVASTDGQINLKLGLSEAPDASPPMSTGVSPTQNLTVRMQGALVPDAPLDVNLTTVVGAVTQTADSHPVTGPDGKVNNLVQNAVIITEPDPKSGANPGSYQVHYQVIFPGQAGEDDCQGNVLLKVGQTITVQNAPGLGSLNLTLTTAAY